MRVPAHPWLAALIRQGTAIALVVGVAVISGQIVQHAVAARRLAAQGRIEPSSIVPLSAATGTTPATSPLPVAQGPRPDPAHRPLDCAASLVLRPEPGGVMMMTLTAPCDGAGIVRIGHAGVEIAKRLPEGKPLRMAWPVLDRRGVFTVAFEDGRILGAHRSVEGMRDLRRFAVAWEGHARLDLTALEQVMEVTGEVAALPQRAAWRATLGDADLPEAARVQIYTYPADSAEALDLSILATAGSCGRRLTGRTVSSQAGQALSTELSVVLPECDAVAVPLHLKNLDQDVKLAAN